MRKRMQYNQEDYAQLAKKVACQNLSRPVLSGALHPHHGGSRCIFYRDRLKGLYVVVRNFFLLLLNFLPGPAWLLLNKICIPFLADSVVTERTLHPFVFIYLPSTNSKPHRRSMALFYCN